MTICALAWLAQRLVFLIVDFPFNLVITSLAEVIQGSRFNPLSQFAVFVQLKFGLVLVFLTLLFSVGRGHTDVVFVDRFLFLPEFKMSRDK